MCIFATVCSLRRVGSASGFRRLTLNNGNVLMMDPYVTPVGILFRHFLLLPTRQQYDGRRTKTVPSSMSNLWTPLERRDPHDKQLGNLLLLLGTLSGTLSTSAFCTVASSKAQVQFYSPETLCRDPRVKPCVSKQKDVANCRCSNFSPLEHMSCLVQVEFVRRLQKL